MINRQDIHDALSPLNGIHFSIPDLDEYADKLIRHASFLEERTEDEHALIGFIAWYEDGPECFISMIWIHPKFRRYGVARRLLKGLVQLTTKDIALEVHRDNPAVSLYESEGFERGPELTSSVRMTRKQRVAIMQPYSLPYLGYFNLIHASTRFVFLDDVNLPKKGWVNRNRLLLDGKPHGFTVPLAGASQNRLISNTGVQIDPRWRRSWLKTIRSAYARSPYLEAVFPRIEKLLSNEHKTIADFAIETITEMHEHLGVPFNFLRSSTDFQGSESMRASERLIHITKGLGCTRYVNLPGGKNLYSGQEFEKLGVQLEFVEPQLRPYAQRQTTFVPGLSILDVLMNTAPADARRMLGDYTISSTQSN